MSTEQPGRTPRQSSGGSPMGSTIAIVVTVIAVILGFIILKQIRDDDGGGVQPANTTTTTEGSTIPVETTPVVTDPPIVDVFTGTKVQVANSSTQDGAAGVLTTALLGKGFDMATATNGTIKVEASKVLYAADVAGALDVANTVARIMGNIAVEASTIPIPTSEAAFPEGTGVLVLLGNDRAGKTLAQMNGEVATDETTTTTTG